MFHFKKLGLLFTFNLLFSSSLVFAEQDIPTGKYSLDPIHSKIGFEIAHLIISSVEGRFNSYKGSINIDPQNIENSTFESEIQAASIDTGVKGRDEHLKNEDFFDVINFPLISFKSKKVSWSKPNIKIIGDFTMHGKTKEITLEGKYTGSIKDMSGTERIAFRTSTTIDRRDFGISWNMPVEGGLALGNDVLISIVMEATKNKNK